MSERVVVVTGAAGGIGAALVRRFAAQGDTVALLDLPGPALAAVTDDVAGRVSAYPVDLADPAPVAGTFDAVRAELGVPAVLVNNAAVRVFTPLLDIDVERWQSHQDVNLRGALLCLQHAARAMIDAGTGGCIVNITSIAADRAVAHNAAYGVAKAGLAALTRYAAVELGAHGIRVVAVAPGPVATPLTEEAFGGPLRETLLARMAVPEVARPDDVADTVLWVTGPRARFTSGTTLYVDGGYTAS